MVLRHVTLISIIYFASLVSAAARCYYPNGILQPEHTPCHPRAKQSNCCAPDDICLSNGLCYRGNTNRVRREVSHSRLTCTPDKDRACTNGVTQSCTDPTFRHPSCTSICTGPDDHPYGWADVIECPLSNKWYCGRGNQSRCETGETFEIADGYIDDNRGKLHRGTSNGQQTVTVTKMTPSCTTPSSDGSLAQTFQASPSPNLSTVAFTSKASCAGTDFAVLRFSFGAIWLLLFHTFGLG